VRAIVEAAIVQGVVRGCPEAEIMVLLGGVGEARVGLENRLERRVRFEPRVTKHENLSAGGEGMSKRIQRMKGIQSLATWAGSVSNGGRMNPSVQKRRLVI
jgi:hypothetical protein